MLNNQFDVSSPIWLTRVTTMWMERSVTNDPIKDLLIHTSTKAGLLLLSTPMGIIS